MIDAAYEALASALPLESIELQAALAAACAAAGDATQAQALRERFVARHRALIGD